MNDNCTSKDFKTDISQLCNKCPLISKINKGLEEQIVFQAREQKEVLNKKQFEAYIENEINAHQKAKQRVFLTEKQNKNYKDDPNRAKRIELYIWNKECIKALNRVRNTKGIKTIFKFENNFDTTSEDKVFEHFSKGLVKSKMLTEKVLNEYLIQAFEKQTPPQILFSLNNVQSKSKVMKVFYEYYKNIAGKPHGKQSNYASLLGDYFQGYKTNNVKTNFSKSVY